MSIRDRAAVIVLGVLFSLPTASALPAQRLRDDTNLVVRAAAERSERFVIRGVALGRESLDTLELEPMQLWAADARIVLDGETFLPPPNERYFKGRVKGVPDSLVYLAVRDGRSRGSVFVGARRFAIGTGIPVKHSDAANAPFLVQEIDDVDEAGDPGASWTCDVEEYSPALANGTAPSVPSAAAAGLKPVSDAGNVAGATYKLKIAIETDNELWVGLGSNLTTFTNYVTDLVAKASIIYQRDLATTLLLGDVHSWTTASDPWSAGTGGTTGAALAELGTYWHNNYAATQRSAVVMISGKSFYGGVAWRGMLCADDFYCGDSGQYCGSATYAAKYAGSYAFCGTSGTVSTTTPDPTATVNGVQYGLPLSNSWMLLQFAHELGHVANGPHTHCVSVTAEDRTRYGVSDGRAYVDQCYSGECFNGTETSPAELGTVMSYCHNIFLSGGYRASRYLFWKAGEISELMRSYFSSELEAGTPNGVITTQSAPLACSAGRTASVASCSGCTYAWTATGASITAGAATNGVTFTPTSTSVTLQVTITNAKGCAIVTSVTVAASCSAVSAPTNLTATATGATVVALSWTASDGATSYKVYRRTSTGSSYAQVATGVGGTSYNDTTVGANTGYQYVVRATNASGDSGDSNADFTVTIAYAESISAGSTTIKASHFTEMTTAVNALRTLCGLGAVSFATSTPAAGVTVLKSHIDDLRTALSAARSALGNAISFAETLTATSTHVKASHITEIRNGVL